MNGFSDFFPFSVLCYILKFLIITFFVFVFYVVTLAFLLMPIGKLHFQISNCNVFRFVTLVIFAQSCYFGIYFLHPVLF